MILTLYPSDRVIDRSIKLNLELKVKEVPDFEKLFVEGYEKQVLEGSVKYLSRGLIRYIYAECVFGHDDDRLHTSFYDIHSFLKEYGFCFLCCYTESIRLKSGCSMGNVLFALQSRLPEKVPGRVKNVV